VADGLNLWRESFRAWVDQGDHSVLSLSISAVGGTMAGFDPHLAIEFAVLAESDAIAHMAAFATNRDLVPLLESHPAEVAAARERVRDMDYDDAVAHLDALIGGLIGEPVAADEAS
jgi:hypothetical protein